MDKLFASLDSWIKQYLGKLKAEWEKRAGKFVQQALKAKCDDLEKQGHMHRDFEREAEKERQWAKEYRK